MKREKRKSFFDSLINKNKQKEDSLEAYTEPVDQLEEQTKDEIELELEIELEPSIEKLETNHLENPPVDEEIFQIHSNEDHLLQTEKEEESAPEVELPAEMSNIENQNIENPPLENKSAQEIEHDPESYEKSTSRIEQLEAKVKELTERLEQKEQPKAETTEPVSEPVTEPVPEQIEEPLPYNNETLLEIRSEMTKLQELQKSLNSDFMAKLKYDQHKESLIDRLHNEVQEYKQDLVKSTMMPVINDLIMVIDGIQKLTENHRSSEQPIDPEKLLKQMEMITGDIEEVLYRQGVEPYESLEETFNPLKQKVHSTEMTQDGDKEKKIARRYRKGYEWDGKNIRKEFVSVYTLDKKAKVNSD
ncbi:nucleotide exchange factor GrpE [Alkalihalobacterium chitinilyticum]|uniref:Nucleotide exchange factor GrpE n=1 Tax=Alkalihalobacterium chitinilyticum TaxID=2980103 RepID=A0ABT5VF11_9BACI|nr:nucleotide exchange factor GrpE [Alkalihalobacterium chitinilyticum]MDE5414055.1 nucleotide exchange factor GrpE [Alkalihalobacterium chitinilyticum]